MIKRYLSILAVCMMLTSLIPPNMVFADEPIQEMSEETAAVEIAPVKQKIMLEGNASEETAAGGIEQSANDEDIAADGGKKSEASAGDGAKLPTDDADIAADAGKESEETAGEETEPSADDADIASDGEKVSEEAIDDGTEFPADGEDIVGIDGKESEEAIDDGTEPPADDVYLVSDDAEISGEEESDAAEDPGLTEESTENSPEFPGEIGLIDKVQVMEEDPGITPVSGDEQEVTQGQAVSVELEKGEDISQDQEFSFMPKKDGYYRLVISGFKADAGLHGAVQVYDENHYEKFSASFESNQKYRLWIPAKSRYLFHLSVGASESGGEGTVKFKIKVKKAPDIKSITVKNVPEGPWNITEVSAKLKQADFEVLYSDDTSLRIENWEAGGWYHNDFSGIYLTGKTSAGDAFLLQLVGDYIPQSIEDNPVPLTEITPAGSYQMVLYETSRGSRKVELTGAPGITVTVKSVQAEKIELGGTYKPQFEENDKPVYYKYTPIVTGNYSLDLTGGKMAVTLYDEDFHQLARQDGSTISRMVYELEAGKSYYYRLTGPAEPEEELSAHFYKVNDVTGMKLISLPDKREYVIGKEEELVTKGMQVKLTYADGSEQTLSEDNKYEDGKGNSAEAALYKSDAEGNPDYDSGEIKLQDVEQEGIYWLSQDIYTIYGDFNYSSRKLLGHNPVQIAFVREASDSVLKLTADSLKLSVGQSTKKLKVSEMAKGDSLVSVESDNTKILKVSKVKADGTFKLTAKKKTGTVNLTVTLASGAKKTIKVKVQKEKVTTTKIKGVKKKLTLKVGGKKTLKPEIKPITTQDEEQFTSSDEEIASVSEKGVITAKKAGTAEITVQSGSKTAVCVVTVEE